MVVLGQKAATLIGFIVCQDGAQMRCHYCGADAPLAAHGISAQILLFQEAHFGCDPHVDGAGGC